MVWQEAPSVNSHPVPLFTGLETLADSPHLSGLASSATVWGEQEHPGDQGAVAKTERDDVYKESDKIPGNVRGTQLISH